MYNDTSMSTLIYELDLVCCNKIKDIGNLRKIKKLVVNGFKNFPNGVYLLKELEELTIVNRPNFSARIFRTKKNNSQIKKLLKINPNVKIINQSTTIYEQCKSRQGRYLFHCNKN